MVIEHTTPTPTPQTIRNRWDPCTCGCEGSDPWHRAKYRRVVHVSHLDWNVGWVQLPFSTVPVRVRRIFPSDVRFLSELASRGAAAGDWEVIQSSVVRDKR